jgi:hypothetical protein
MAAWAADSVLMMERKALGTGEVGSYCGIEFISNRTTIPCITGEL